MDIDVYIGNEGRMRQFFIGIFYSGVFRFESIYEFVGEYVKSFLDFIFRDMDILGRIGFVDLRF